MRARGQRGPDRRPRLTAARVQAAQAASEGISPLELMLRLMRERWAGGDRDGALQAASMAAPYCHARLAPRIEAATDEQHIVTIRGGLRDSSE